MMLIHFSNMFLDKPFSYYRNPDFGRHFRERLKNILAEVIDASIRRKVDGVLIAGNLFCEDWVTEDTVRYVMGLLESLNHIPVFIAPGETDCLCEDSVYLYQAFPKNVYIFTKPVWEVISDDELPLCVVGCGKHKNVVADSELPIQALNRDMSNICLVHTLGIQYEKIFLENDTPFSYVALGDYLFDEKKELPNGVVLGRSGAPERFDFYQPGTPGFNCVHFTLDQGRWKVSNVERLSVKGTTFQEIIVDCSNYTESEDLLHEVNLNVGVIPTPKVVKVKLVGKISLSMFNEVLKNIDKVLKECDDFVLSPDVEFVEVSEEYDCDSPFLLSEFFRIAKTELNSISLDKAQQAIRRGIYLVLSARMGKKPELPWGIG
ncbi:MAG: hypothetical protein N3G21_01315 [Candidatus Hydrogenedentes bacterium]|nr:hypothetical protein [Candidatus Hydrogenedentota bacterium]